MPPKFKSNNQENQKTEEMMTQKSQKQQVTEPIAKKKRGKTKTVSLGFNIN